MAITQVYYNILKQAFGQGILPQSASILEFGEANLYKDVTIEDITSDIETLVDDQGRRDALKADLHKSPHPLQSFDAAKVIYRMLFSAQRLAAIDLRGTETALPLDLNEPVELDGPFDVTINNGTAEHVFNIGQAFKTIHEQTAFGGLMIHEGPFTGWYNHGFYNLQPTLFYDLAKANSYGIVAYFCCLHTPARILQVTGPQDLLNLAERNEIPDNAVHIIMLRKNLDAPFVYPMQGVYSGTLDEKQQLAWRNLRAT